MNDKFIEESFRGNLICRVELDRSRQKSDGFLPLSQLELTLCLVEARPTRLSYLLLQLRRDLRFRLKRLRLALTLAFSPKPLKPSDDRENGNRRHHRVANALLDLFVPFALRNAHVNILNLFPT